MEKNGLAASASKMILFQTNIRFLGHDIYQGTIKPIQRSLAFADKFPDEIKDRKQLQRFFFPKLRQKCAPLYQRLRKNPSPWTETFSNCPRSQTACEVFTLSRNPQSTCIHDSRNWCIWHRLWRHSQATIRVQERTTSSFSLSTLAWSIANIFYN